MSEIYLGKLDFADPLYDILSSNVCPDVKDPLFHVNRMSLRLVYKYTEEKTRIAIIGKFFKLHDTKQDSGEQEILLLQNHLSDIFLRVIRVISMVIKKHSGRLL